MPAPARPPTLAIILARAGSKGVPGKNTAPIAGKPCIRWTIDAALDARTIDHVAVSTDDPRAASIAHEAGVPVIERPAPLATDSARVDDAARHAVEHVERSSARCARAVILYANVPVRPAGLIDRAVRIHMETACDSVQSYAPVGKYHPWWMAVLDPVNGAVRPWEGDTLNHNVYRRQELPAAYVPDGGVLVVSRQALFSEVPGLPPGPHAFVGRDRRGVTTGEGEVIDVDAALDLIVADAVLRARMR